MKPGWAIAQVPFAKGSVTHSCQIWLSPKRDWSGSVRFAKILPRKSSPIQCTSPRARGQAWRARMQFVLATWMAELEGRCPNRRSRQTSKSPLGELDHQRRTPNDSCLCRDERSLSTSGSQVTTPSWPGMHEKNESQCHFPVNQSFVLLTILSPRFMWPSENAAALNFERGGSNET